MKIKKFLASDYRTAIRQAKSEMGRDAIILHSRQVKRSGIIGWFTPPQVEITVAMDDTLQVYADRSRQNMAATSWPTVAPVKPVPAPQTDTAKEMELLDGIKRMNYLMEEMRNQLHEVESTKGLSQPVQDFYQTLIKNRVKPEVAMNIAISVQNRLPQDPGIETEWAYEVCLHTLREYVKNISPIGVSHSKTGRLVFLIGPTGVGKTTTVAKLAAKMTFLEGKKAALITLDTYRVSAADQLRTFADIMGIPLSVVFSDTEILEAVDQYQDKDVILVDTAGSSPFNQEQIGNLERFVKVAQPDEIILVLSVTTDSDDLLNIYHQFESIGIDKIVFTKLDEAMTFGQILNVLYETRKPIAYVTTGQNVPDDIEIPDSTCLARMFLGEEVME
jgi:flagellar biosynthesis protein FlhF